MSYAKQIEQQIAQYAETINMHDLPAIFHRWSERHYGPGLRAVFGVDTIDAAYALACREAMPANRTLSIYSIGCGDGQVEMRLARALLAEGISDFQIIAADLSPYLLGRLSASLREDSALASRITPLEADLNDLRFDRQHDVIMANHSLHHIVNLEGVFEASYNALTDKGIFATADMIGRNGHMRWPEAAVILKAFWPLLRLDQRYHVQLKRLEAEFLDHDCSNEGFEGIRAEDILPLMNARFHAKRFFGTGGIVDPFIDRGFGHHLNPQDERDVALVDCIGLVNDVLLDLGAIKPTQMMAHFSKDASVSEAFYRTRSAHASVRSSLPKWSEPYIAEAAVRPATELRATQAPASGPASAAAHPSRPTIARRIANKAMSAIRRTLRRA